jgi:hypothetical protein
MLRRPIGGSLTDKSHLRPAPTSAAPQLQATRWRVDKRRVPLFVLLFLIALVVPIQIYVGPLRLSPYRIVLILSLVPCLLLLFSKQVGRILPSDILVILSACWAALALMVVHGPATAFQTSGIHVIETVGAYLLARCYIRDKGAFFATARLLFRIVVVLLPFAIHEALTGRSLPLSLLGSVAPVIAHTTIGGRFGLSRAQVLLEHPILYGVFCASAFALTWYVLGFRQSVFMRVGRSALVILATGFSLSAGAFAAIIIQAALIAWEYATRGMRTRWRLLSLLCVIGYFVIDVLSNRTPYHVLVTYLTFNVQSAYNRILIWQYGSAEVWRHPLFGIGLGDWERPSYMSSSMDNFWLLIAVRYGLPAFVMFAAAVFLIFRSIGRVKIADRETNSCRLGLLITLGGLAIAGSTVHFWNAIYCLFMFLLGSGAWILSAHNETLALEKSQRSGGASKRRSSAYSGASKDRG